MNKLTISDLHCGTYYKAHFLSEETVNTLYEYYDFGLERDPSGTADTILILPGDIFNLAEAVHSLDIILHYGYIPGL